MDCRVSLLLGLGLLVGGSGCTPSFSSRNTTTPETPGLTQGQTAPAEAVATNVSAGKKEKDLPRRKPKAMTCVAGGDFYFRDSQDPRRSPQEQQERRETARGAYLQALQIDPGCVEAHIGLARVSAAEEKLDQSITSYRAALNASPKAAVVWFELGMCHSRRKEWEPAIDALANASELAPDNRQCANILGHCLARAGRFEQSLAHFTPLFGEAEARFKVARAMLHQGQADQARVQLQLALKLDPKLANARDMLAQLDSGKAPTGQPIVPVQYEQPQR